MVLQMFVVLVVPIATRRPLPHTVILTVGSRCCLDRTVAVLLEYDQNSKRCPNADFHGRQCT